MTSPQEHSDLRTELPTAKINIKKRRISIVWIVPIIAAAISGYLIYSHIQRLGPKITIQFEDASGIKAGLTAVKYRGVTIGEVSAIALDEDQKHVLVSARLQQSASTISREGSQFWIVRPKVSLENVTGLGTVIAGPEIQVVPGDGETASTFIGLEAPPLSPEQRGLAILLVADHVGSLRVDSPIYYRGVEVGVVRDIQLGTNAAVVDIRGLIGKRYIKLVHDDSKFWDVGGVDISGGLLSGIKFNVQSFQSMFVGGIAFATPNESGSRASKKNTVFRLYDKPADDWLNWAPKINISPEKEHSD